MCGIAAYLGNDIEEGKDYIKNAKQLLAHRGPDDDGSFIGESIVLGHRRLSIVDLSRSGHQPMMSSDGRYVIVYNREIYNHLEL